MDLQIDGRICLVTGAGAGIGLATAVALAAEGARVVIAARSTSSLQRAKEGVLAAGGQPPVLIAADLSEPDGLARVAAQALSEVGKIDVLVNNAGGSRPLQRADDEDAWDEGWRLNFLAARRLTEGLIAPMLDRRWGRVINVSGAIVAKALNAASPAKAALESWSKAAAAAYAAQGVTFNCVAPGRIESRQISENLHPTVQSRQDYIDRNIPAGRFGQPEEAAALIAFLASGRASYITGATIPVDGGALRYAF